MILIKKILLALALTLLIFPGISFGETFTIELNANSSDVEGKFEARLPGYETSLNLGGGVLYGKDERLISNVNFFLKDEIFLPALTLGLGFKGIYGYQTYGDTNYDIAGLGFLLLGEYDFRIDYPRVPILISVNSSLVPGPLAFKYAEQYFDVVLTAYVYLVDNAALLVGYRNIDIKLKIDDTQYREKDNAAFFGCRILF